MNRRREGQLLTYDRAGWPSDLPYATTARWFTLLLEDGERITVDRATLAGALCLPSDRDDALLAARILEDPAMLEPDDGTTYQRPDPRPSTALERRLLQVATATLAVALVTLALVVALLV